MRLIDPGVGEVTDRLTILSLKILYGTEAGKDVSHFQREQTALLAKIRTKDPTGPWLQHTLELAVVNAALWQAEDELRRFRASSGANPMMANGLLELTAATAFRIQALNDRRSELVALINKEAGDGTAPEKL